MHIYHAITMSIMPVLCLVYQYYVYYACTMPTMLIYNQSLHKSQAKNKINWRKIFEILSIGYCNGPMTPLLFLIFLFPTTNNYYSVFIVPLD